MYPLHSLETRYGHPRQKLQTKHFVGVSLVHFVEFREKAAYKVLLESKSAKNVFACLVLVVLVVQHSHFQSIRAYPKIPILVSYIVAFWIRGSKHALLMCTGMSF